MKGNGLRSIVLLSLLAGWVGPLQAAPHSPAPAVLADALSPASGLQTSARPAAPAAAQSRVIPTPDRVYNTPHVHWLPLPSPDGRRVSIETWNGEPVLESAGASLIEAAGGYRYYPGLAWE